jgi:hypothetical protein
MSRYSVSPVEVTDVFLYLLHIYKIQGNAESIRVRLATVSVF